GDVLERRLGVAADDAGQAADPLGELRVALVRHRARALLALAERLLGFQHFSPLEAANLERDLLERPGRDGHGHAALGVAIALDDLGRDRLRLEPELAAYLFLDLGIDVGEVPDRARQLADGDGAARAPQALDVPTGLHVPHRHLEPERRRLGVHA